MGEGLAAREVAFEGASVGEAVRCGASGQEGSGCLAEWRRDRKRRRPARAAPIAAAPCRWHPGPLPTPPPDSTTGEHPLRPAHSQQLAQRSGRRPCPRPLRPQAPSLRARRTSSSWRSAAPCSSAVRGARSSKRRSIQEISSCGGPEPRGRRQPRMCREVVGRGDDGSQGGGGSGGGGGSVGAGCSNVCSGSAALRCCGAGHWGVHQAGAAVRQKSRKPATATARAATDERLGRPCLTPSSPHPPNSPPIPTPPPPTCWNRCLYSSASGPQ